MPEGVSVHRSADSLEQHAASMQDIRHRGESMELKGIPPTPTAVLSPVAQNNTPPVIISHFQCDVDVVDESWFTTTYHDVQKQVQLFRTRLCHVLDRLQSVADVFMTPILTPEYVKGNNVDEVNAKTLSKLHLLLFVSLGLIALVCDTTETQLISGFLSGGHLLLFLCARFIPMCQVMSSLLSIFAITFSSLYFTDDDLSSLDNYEHEHLRALQLLLFVIAIAFTNAIFGRILKLMITIVHIVLIIGSQFLWSTAASDWKHMWILIVLMPCFLDALGNQQTTMYHKETMQGELNRQQNNFLAHMSHELRTPLHHILGIVDYLLLETKTSYAKIIGETGADADTTPVASHLSPTSFVQTDQQLAPSAGPPTLNRIKSLPVGKTPTLGVAQHLSGGFLARGQTVQSTLLDMEHEMIEQDRSGFMSNVTCLVDDEEASIVDTVDEHFDHMQSLLNVRHSANLILSVINNIFDLARIDNNTMELDEFPMDVRATVGEIVKVVSEKQFSAHIQVHLQMGDNVPSWVLSDPARLQQIILNLMANAISFTSVGSVTIRVYRLAQNYRPNEDKRRFANHAAGLPTADPIGDAELQDGEAAWVRFEVEDTGVGMDDDMVAKCFQRFSNTRDGKNIGLSEHTGIGLGLHVSYQLVRLLGGTMHVQSKIGKGTTFTFDLPLRLAAEADIPPLEERGSGLGNVESGRQNVRSTASASIGGMQRLGSGLSSRLLKKISSPLIPRPSLMESVVDGGVGIGGSNSASISSLSTKQSTPPNQQRHHQHRRVASLRSGRPPISDLAVLINLTEGGMVNVGKGRRVWTDPLQARRIKYPRRTSSSQTASRKLSMRQRGTSTDSAPVRGNLPRISPQRLLKAGSVHILPLTTVSGDESDDALEDSSSDGGKGPNGGGEEETEGTNQDEEKDEKNKEEEKKKEEKREGIHTGTPHREEDEAPTLIPEITPEKQDTHGKEEEDEYKEEEMGGTLIQSPILRSGEELKSISTFDVTLSAISSACQSTSSLSIDALDEHLVPPSNPKRRSSPLPKNVTQLLTEGRPRSFSAVSKPLSIPPPAVVSSRRLVRDDSSSTFSQSATRSHVSLSATQSSGSLVDEEDTDKEKDTSKRKKKNKSSNKNPYPTPVLIVDDIATNRKVLEKFLSTAHIGFESVTNGEEAVEAWITHQYQVILMDIMMPVMDGKEATRRIREFAEKNGLRQPQIIAVTAANITKDEASTLGFDEMMSKPFRLKSILGCVKKSFHAIQKGNRAGQPTTASSNST